MKIDTRGFAKRCVQEVLLYSGQFALFYVLMQAIVDGGRLFGNLGHTVLLVALVVQTALLAAFGGRVAPRVLGSFLVPAVYTALELAEGAADALNAAHVGFWLYAACAAALMTGKLRARKTTAYEALLIVVNVAIFVFLYFYFDTWKETQDKAELTILVIFSHLPAFLGDPTHWFIMVGGAILALTIALSRIEVEQLRARIYALFGTYVDTGIRDLIVEGGAAGSSRRELCILFSDIRDFTALCERHDPGDITRMLNLFFEEWNQAVKRHNGVVDKYMGDAIMIIFGLRDGQGACEAAVACAVEMESRREAIRDQVRRLGLPVPEGFGVGVHFGEMIVGDIGSDDRKNFTVIGDAVNVAARLEAETRKTPGAVLISGAVHERLSAGLQRGFAEVGEVELKGKDVRIRAFLHRPPEGALL